MLPHHQHKDIMILQNTRTHSITQQHIPDDIQFHLQMLSMYIFINITYLVCPCDTNTNNLLIPWSLQNCCTRLVTAYILTKHTLLGRTRRHRVWFRYVVRFQLVSVR